MGRRSNSNKVWLAGPFRTRASPPRPARYNSVQVGYHPDSALLLERPADKETPFSPSGAKPILTPLITRLTFSPIGAICCSQRMGSTETLSPFFASSTTSRPLDKKTSWSPIGAGPLSSSFDKRTSTSRPFYRRSTTSRSYIRPAVRPPDYYLPDDWYNWKPPVIKPEPPPRVLGASESGHTTNLEKFIWVTLGGFGVLVLIAIFMKIGKPIRRARRQVSSARPVTGVTNIGLHPDHDDEDSDLGSLTRLTDIAASADPGDLPDDLPPPYSECVRSSINKGVGEDPPPPYSAFCVSYTNIKDVEPQVHIHHPIGYGQINPGVKAE